MDRTWRTVLTIAALIGLASAARAQTTPSPESDPIGAVLDQAAPSPALAPPAASPPAAAIPPPPPAPAPPATVNWYGTPGTRQAPANAPPLAPAPPAYIPRGYVAPPQPPVPQAEAKLTAPMHIEETGRTPDRPLNANDLGYETRLRSSFAAAQGMQGPLDGRWLLTGPDGATLYSFQLVDSAVSGLEGAWGDPRRPGVADGSGFVDEISRTGSQLYLRFTPRPGRGASVATLAPSADGSWRGDLIDQGDRRSVILKRQ